MTKTFGGIPFDEDIFSWALGQEPDPVLTALIESGIVVDDASVTAQLSGGGYAATTRFWNKLKDTAPQNFNGATDFEFETTSADMQRVRAFWRMKGWDAVSYTQILTGADPLGHMVTEVSDYWKRYRQSLLVAMMKMLPTVNTCSASKLDSTGKAAWVTAWTSNHKYDISSATSTITSDNRVSYNTVLDAQQKACGDNAFGAFRLIGCSSETAKNLFEKQHEYIKYTNARGEEVTSNIATVNGNILIIDDACNNSDGTTNTFVCGAGMFIKAKPSMKGNPENSFDRDEAKKGGTDRIFTRRGFVLHPNGFSFDDPEGCGESPTDEQLTAKGNYSIKFDPKAIPFTCIVSNQ